MPMLVNACDPNSLLDKIITTDPMKRTIQKFIEEVQIRAGKRKENAEGIFSYLTPVPEQAQTNFFKIINMAKVNLNTTFQKEQTDGKEPSEEDLLMIKILENDLPDIIIKECNEQSGQRNMYNIFQGHGGRKSKKSKKSRKSRKNKKTRKYRKV